MKISWLVAILGYVSAFVLAWGFILDWIQGSTLTGIMFVFFLLCGILGGLFMDYKPPSKR